MATSHFPMGLSPTLRLDLFRLHRFPSSLIQNFQSPHTLNLQANWLSRWRSCKRKLLLQMRRQTFLGFPRLVSKLVAICCTQMAATFLWGWQVCISTSSIGLKAIGWYHLFFTVLSRNPEVQIYLACVVYSMDQFFSMFFLLKEIIHTYM